MALRLASTRSYELILLDLMLPSMDGLEVCRRLRREGIQTPILMLTAKDAVQDRVKGLGVGLSPRFGADKAHSACPMAPRRAFPP